MPVLNDEVPDEGDFDAGRRRGEFDDITPEDFIRGSGHGNPPGWLGPADISRARRQLPIAYVEIVPIRTDDLGRVSRIGSLLHVSDDGSIERTLITGRVLFHESIREAIARNVAKDLGDIALPMLPQRSSKMQLAHARKKLLPRKNPPKLDRGSIPGLNYRRAAESGSLFSFICSVFRSFQYIVA